jgi:hypothetical protein
MNIHKKTLILFSMIAVLLVFTSILFIKNSEAIDVTENEFPIVNVENQTFIYDGTAKQASVSIIPFGLSYTVTYNGNTKLPTEVGIYQVVVRVNTAGYNKTISGYTLKIVPANSNVLGAEKFTFTLPLKVGSKGNEVKELQSLLISLGYNDVDVVDGKFGLKTKSAVIKFQLANGLKGDGIVGILTRSILNK